MSCCGKSRTARQIENSGDVNRVVVPARAIGYRYFEYVGKTALTVIGPVSGRRYGFTHPGDLLPVDERDGPSMAAVPNLRKAPAPE
jgi:hypothetical protein